MSEQNDGEFFDELSSAADDDGSTMDITQDEEGNIFADGVLIPDDILEDPQRISDFLYGLSAGAPAPPPAPPTNGHRPDPEQAFRRLLGGP